jgi:competence protein ComEA
MPAQDPVSPGRSEFVAGPDDLVALVGERSASSSGRHRRIRAPDPSWVRLPAAFAQARWHPGRAAVAGVVGLALLALLLLGMRVAWARSTVDADIVAPGVPPGATGVESAAAPVGLPDAAPTATASPGGEPSPTAGGTVVVHVVGRVRDPGVRHLPAGARVADALEAAGGATKRADLAAVNLARVLVDGEQILVPAPGETPSAAPGGATGGAPTGSPVSLNDADVPALETLPGVGPVLARRIVDWRTVHGRFSSVDELAEVSGIGEKLLAQLRPLVTT